MATDGAKHNTAGEPFRLDDLVAQVNHWLEDMSSQRKVLARRPERGLMKREERLMMQAARMVQDHGLISIITKRQNGIITFIAERAI